MGGLIMAKNIKKIAEILGARIVAEVPETGGGAFGAHRLAEIVARLQPASNPEVPERFPMIPTGFEVHREGRRWTKEEFEQRLYQAPEKIEFVGGIFASERERLTVLAMLLEILGIDRAIQFGKIEDWKAAIAAREKPQGMSGSES